MAQPDGGDLVVEVHRAERDSDDTFYYIILIHGYWDCEIVSKTLTTSRTHTPQHVSLVFDVVTNNNEQADACAVYHFNGAVAPQSLFVNGVSFPPGAITDSQPGGNFTDCS